MSVTKHGDLIVLGAACDAGDAETLASELSRRRSSCIDAGLCQSMHGAVLQVLIAFKPDVGRRPADAFINRLISDALDEE